MKTQIYNSVDTSFQNILTAAQSALDDTRYYENQIKQIKKIELALKKIEAHVAWAQMH